MVYKWLNIIQNTLLPSTCTLCGQRGQEQLALCADCHKELKFIGNSCIQCALPIDDYDSALICGQCLQRPPAFDRSLCLFTYETPARQLILSLKFRNKLAHARLLGSLLGLSVKHQAEELPDCILPVPLARQRIRERGFNQSLELSRPVSRLLDIPIQHRLIKRIRHTPAQSQLKLPQRHHNIRHAFQVEQQTVPAYIAIVDDVMTSGSTCHEIARVLKLAGARRVDVWCIARAVK